MPEIIIGVAAQIRGRTFWLRKPYRHDNIFDKLGRRPAIWMNARVVQGFITSSVRFVDRYEAMNIAKEQKQILRHEQSRLYASGRLISENIW